MNEQPLVSVVMSTYNGAAYLAAQLDTIVQQTYPNLEIIIVDDASTDETVSIITAYQQRDARIRFFPNLANLGPNKSFERAMDLSAGAYIAISDQDDLWDPDKIRIMLTEWPDHALFVYCLPGRFYNNDPSTRHSIGNWRHTDMNDWHKLVFNTPISGHASMFRRELLAACKPFPPDIYYDWWLSMHAARKKAIGFIPKTLAWQRVHEGNYSLQVYQLGKDEKRARLRNQWIKMIEAFFSRHPKESPERRSLLYYAQLLKQLDGHRFSWPMFHYAWKHRKKIFHYKKKKPLIIISHFKHALRLARTGVIG